jgi:hypothetical protein
MTVKKLIALLEDQPKGDKVRLMIWHPSKGYTDCDNVIRLNNPGGTVNIIAEVE